MSSRSPSERLLKQALSWFFLLQSESCTDEDRQRFNHWFCKSEAHQAAYAHAERLWSEVDRLKEAADVPGLREARQWRSKRKSINVVGWAVFFLISSVLMRVGWLEYSAETIIYSTQLGEQHRVTLADGSSIIMNTATRLSVRISPLQRKIMLDTGEAIFNVQHEIWRPFIVNAGALQIRDIGTRFNVHKQQAGPILVTVLEGAVEINGVRLNAGYQQYYSPYADPRTLLRPIDIGQVEAWQHGQLVFRQTRLGRVVAELERYHPIHFVFLDPAIARETLSGTFGTDDLPFFLSSLEKILPVRVKPLPGNKSLLIDWADKKM
ncbi:protein FecR [Nitrosomonas stercoris]|uniref:Protein FecR n=1 Tax=Nitrosomonas stercoris TaxID=1444684 RepID=A0A4Y1YLG8_9PROT|nr:protein FecR [Nitrosomonas stercoris]